MFDDKWEIDKKNLQLGKELGSGQFGVCSTLLSLTHTHMFTTIASCAIDINIDINFDLYPFIPHSTHNICTHHTFLEHSSVW